MNVKHCDTFIQLSLEYFVIIALRYAPRFRRCEMEVFCKYYQIKNGRMSCLFNIGVDTVAAAYRAIWNWSVGDGKIRENFSTQRTIKKKLIDNLGWYIFYVCQTFKQREIK